MEIELANPTHGTQTGALKYFDVDFISCRRRAMSEMFTAAKTIRVAMDVLSARPSNGTAKAKNTETVTVVQVAIKGVWVLVLIRPRQAGRSPCRAMP